MLNRKAFLVLLSGALFLALVGSQDASREGRAQVLADADTWRVAFVSDTQSPMVPETIRLSRNNNELARAKIFDSIIQFLPHSIFQFGDLVSLGFYDPAWEAIDAFLDQLHYVEGLITGTSAIFTVRMLKDNFSSFADAMTVRFDFERIRPGTVKDSVMRQ